MSIPRIARIHFVYQFIILTLIIFGISYIEILPDKRFLFLALIPVFSYQLIIIFCCTELLPLPYWLAWTQSEGLSTEKQYSDDTESPNTSSQEPTSPKENCVISPIIPRARLYTKNKNSVSSSDANTQTVYQNVLDIFKKAPASSTSKPSIRRSNSIKIYDLKQNETNENTQPCNLRNLQDQQNAKSRSNLKSPSRREDYVNHATSQDTTSESVESDSTVSDSASTITDSMGEAKTHTVRRNVSHMSKKGPVSTKACARRSESTKSYVLRRSESTFDNDLEEKENFQQYQPRNWRSLQDQKTTKSSSNLNASNQSVDETIEITSSKFETSDDTTESDSSDLTRSFSFPFRQRNPGRRIEVGDDLKNELNVPIMPAWNAIDYFSPSIADRRRKSISTEAIDRELRQINSLFEHTDKNDFTKSMEVPKESAVLSVAKRGLKPSASFNKWKQGVSNYFTKTKNDSTKTEDDAQEDGSKTPFYKELFLSKDVFCQDSGKKAASKSKSSPFPKFQNRVKFQSRSPSYVSYDDYI